MKNIFCHLERKINLNHSIPVTHGPTNWMRHVGLRRMRFWFEKVGCDMG